MNFNLKLKKLSSIVLFSALLLLVVFSNPSSATAQKIESMPIFPGGDIGGVFGQSHFYTVNMRGNGDASVLSKIIFSNTEGKDMESFEVSSPSGGLTDLIAFQVVRQPQCIRYGSDYATGSQICLEYQEPDYYQYWYGQNKYLKLNVVERDGVYSVDLPRAVKADKTGALLFYYRLKGDAITDKSLFGSFKYKFSTLKVSDSVQDVTVAIDVDSDLFLKGAKSNVDFVKSVSPMALDAKVTSTSEFASTRYDTVFNQVGQGRIVKNAKNLASGETYTVKGEYADSRLKLFAKEITIGVVLLLVFIAIITTAFILAVKKAAIQNTTFLSLLLVFVSSTVSAILLMAYMIGIKYLMDFMGRYGYQYGLDWMFLPVFVISALIVAFLIFVPAIWWGVKRGLSWGILSLSVSIVVSAFLLIITGLFIFSLNGADFQYMLRGRDGVQTISKPLEVQPAVEGRAE